MMFTSDYSREYRVIIDKTDLFMVAIIATLIVGLTTVGFAQGQGEVIESIGAHGSVNWSQAMVLAKGTGTPAGKDFKKAQGESTTQEAKVDAYGNLLTTIKSVRIDGSSLVKGIAEQNQMIQAQLAGMVKGAQVVKREYLSDGTVEVTVALKLTGGFAQLVLPADITHLPEIKTIAPPHKENNSGRMREESMPASVSTVYTGLVLDARGVRGLPAMSPKIMDESGQEVYGSAFVSREFAVQHGMAGYVRDLKGAQNHPKVSYSPLIVRALRSEGPGRCDFVISNADASKVRSASGNLQFLKKCMVMIVLD